MDAPSSSSFDVYAQKTVFCYWLLVMADWMSKGVELSRRLVQSHYFSGLCAQLSGLAQTTTIWWQR
jgi:hypothetical protein